MQLLDKRINLDLKFEKVIGLAIGYSAWGKSAIRTRQYQLLILCFVIELQTRTTIKEKKVENSYTPHKKKKTFIAKLVASLSLLCFITGGLCIYESLYTTGYSFIWDYTAVLFFILFIVLSMFYFAMDPKEKYYVG
jgi:hypothetical protein